MILQKGKDTTGKAKRWWILFLCLMVLFALILSSGLSMWVYSLSRLRKIDEKYDSIALLEYIGEAYPQADAADEYARAAAKELEGLDVGSFEGVKLWSATNRALGTVEGYSRTEGLDPYPNRAVLLCSQFQEIYEHGEIDLTEEELPEQFVATEHLLGQARMRTQSIGDTGWVNLYEKGVHGTDYVRTVFGENDTVTEEVLDPANPPKEYIKGTYNWELLRYEYYRDGQLIDTVMEVVERGKEALSFSYDARTDHYMAVGKALKGYEAVCENPLYAEGKEETFTVTFDKQEGWKPKAGESYYVHGQFLEDSEEQNAFQFLPFYEGCETAPYQLAGEKTELFESYAKRYQMAKDHVRLEATKDISALEPFQQGVLKIEEGCFPQEGELDVCLISHDIAVQMGLKAGDSIEVSVLDSDEADRFVLWENQREKSIKIVGITSASEEYVGCVWVNEGALVMEQSLFGYLLGTAVLENQNARQIADDLQSACPDKVKITLYDQGYFAAAQPMEIMKSMALMVIIGAASALIFVVLLFVFLRKKQTGWKWGGVSVPVFVFFVSLGMLAAMISDGKKHEEYLYENTKVSAFVTDSNGRQGAEAQISAEDARSIWQSGMVEDINLAIQWNYWLKVYELPDIENFPEDLEKQNEWIRQQSYIVALNDLGASEDFKHMQNPEIVWLEGWDESFLRETEGYSFVSSISSFGMLTFTVPENSKMIYPCVVCEEVLQEKELSLGEEFFVYIRFFFNGGPVDEIIRLKAVGTYEKRGEYSNIYVPLNFWCDFSWIDGEEAILNPGESVTALFKTPEERDNYFYANTKFSECNFRLKEDCDLGLLQEFLLQQELNSIEVDGEQKKMILLQDERFLEAAACLDKVICWGETLFLTFLGSAVLMCVVCFIGWKKRAKEDCQKNNSGGI